MTYQNPNNVHSPKKNWSLVKVIYDGGPDEDALALGKWDDEDGEKPKLYLASRWNGSSDYDDVGAPQSRGLPIWYLLPTWMNEAILSHDNISKKDRELVEMMME